MRPFTYEAYRQMLFDMQSAGYKFLGYGEAADPPFCYLRHDVDVDIEFCLKLAAIEADLGIRSTFCFMLRSVAYNLLAPSNESKICSVLSLGHAPGLHFDSSLYGPDVMEEDGAMRAAIMAEINLLKKVVGKDIELVSFHKPNSIPNLLLGNPELTYPYPHAYARKFMREASYFADSGGSFRYGHPLDSKAFREKRPITLNCHPLWWSKDGRSPLYALKEVVAMQREIVRQYLLDNVVGV